jgi:hypothetical protein
MSKSIYTRKRMSLDNNVLLTLLVFILTSTALFGYSVFKRKEIKEHPPVKILVNGKFDSAQNVFYTVGDLLVFRAPVDPTDKVEWSFGDDTKSEEGSAIAHTFTKPGIRTIRIVVNGKWNFERKIIIKAPPEIVDSVGVETESIINSEPAIAKKPIIFTTPFEATSYEWYIENNNNYKRQTGKQVEFTFNSQDDYTVVLMLDGKRQKKFTKIITVIKPSEIQKPKPLIEDEDIVVAPPPKPKQVDTAKVVVVAPPPIKKQAKRLLTEEQFKLYLQDVVCKGKKAEEFESYLCDGMQTRVVFGKKSEKFDVFCNAIKGKNIRIKSVKLGQGPDNCTTSLTVDYDEPKKFLGVGKTICD